MPIRINLLAEAQAAEDVRRRDPVKRAIWVAVLLVILALSWVGCLQFEILRDNSKLGSLQAKLSSGTNEYVQILTNQRNLDETNEKLAALDRLATNRFLNATVLDALMHSTLDGIQLTTVKTEHLFDVVPEIKPRMGDDKRMIPGKPGSATERIKLYLNAKDTSSNPGGDQVNKFKEILAQTPYFKSQHFSTNDLLLKNLSTPLFDNDSGKAYVQFTFECSYADRVR